MWCDSCNRETEEAVCSICGAETREDNPSSVFWCPDCRIPIVHDHSVEKVDCPLCTGEASYLCSDLRPVFPEERLLFELIEGEPFKYIDSAVWASGSKYYVDGAPISVPVSFYENADVTNLISELKNQSPKNNYTYFDKSIEKFVTSAFS